MTKEQEADIYDILSSHSWLWVIPKKLSCLTDKVMIMMAENPEWALKQLKQINQKQINDYEDFWRSVWTRDKKTKSNTHKKWHFINSNKSKKWRLIERSKKWHLIGFSRSKKKD